jgi:hypothetical protein
MSLEAISAFFLQCDTEGFYGLVKKMEVHDFLYFAIDGDEVMEANVTTPKKNDIIPSMSRNFVAVCDETKDETTRYEIIDFFTRIDQRELARRVGILQHSRLRRRGTEKE